MDEGEGDSQGVTVRRSRQEIETAITPEPAPRATRSSGDRDAVDGTRLFSGHRPRTLWAG